MQQKRRRKYGKINYSHDSGASRNWPLFTGYSRCRDRQIPIDPETNQMAKGIVAQTARAMENVLAILKASGSSSEKILKCCLYIRNMQDFDLINEAYASFFPGDPPARVVVEVSKLPKNADIEIDALAII